MGYRLVGKNKHDNSTVVCHPWTTQKALDEIWHPAISYLGLSLLEELIIIYNDVPNSSAPQIIEELRSVLDFYQNREAPSQLRKIHKSAQIIVSGLEERINTLIDMIESQTGNDNISWSSG